MTWAEVSLAILVALAAASAALAQEHGDRVRVTKVDGQVLIGQAGPENPDRLWVRSPDGKVTSLFRDDVTRIEKSMGIKTRARRGFVIGVGSGAALGSLTGVGLLEFASVLSIGSAGGSENPSRGEIVAAALVGGVVGAVIPGIPLGGIGAFVGHRFKTEKWEIVPAPEALGVQIRTEGLP